MTTEKETTNVSENPVVQTAKEQKKIDTDTTVTLSTGVRVKIQPVSASLIAEVRSKINDPPVPVLYDSEKDRELQNPTDPTYLRQIDEAEAQRNAAVADAMIMFGVELVDPMPKDVSWIKRLNLIGISVDEADPFAVEFAYKKFIAVGTPDLPTIYRASAPVNQEEVGKAMSTFQGDAER